MDMKELLNSYSNFENECDELYQLIVNHFQLNIQSDTKVYLLQKEKMEDIKASIEKWKN
jgi:hypothetical protein